MLRHPRPRPRPRACHALIACALAALVLTAHAPLSRADWAPLGVKLCGRLTAEYSPSMADDGNGGAVIAWVDTRARTETDIYAQRVGANGALLWGVNGLPVCTTSGDQSNPSVVSDGVGGALVLYEWHTRGPYRRSLALQRIIASGTVAEGWPAVGVLVVDTTLSAVSPFAIISDEAGGAYIAWSDSSDASLPGADIVLQHVRGDGSLAPGWPAAGLHVSPAVIEQTSPALVADAAGGVLIVWCEGIAYESETRLMAHRVGASGALAPGWPLAGALVSDAPDGQLNATAVRDGAGGLIASWTDTRAITSESVWAQRMNASGQALWAANGVRLSADRTLIRGLSSTADGAGGAIAFWYEGAITTPAHPFYHNNLGAQRVSGGGTIAAGWPAASFAIVDETDGNRVTGGVVSDGNSGAYFAWWDGRPDAAGIYTQHLTGSAALAPGSLANGSPAVGTNLPQTAPLIVSSHFGGAVVGLLKLWPNSTYYADPFAQRIGPAALVSVEVSAAARVPLEIDAVRPNPARGPVRVEFRTPASGPAIIELVDIAGRVRQRREIGVGGVGSVRTELLDIAGLAPGVYLVRVTQGAESVSRRIAVVR